MRVSTEENLPHESVNRGESPTLDSVNRGESPTLDSVIEGEPPTCTVPKVGGYGS